MKMVPIKRTAADKKAEQAKYEGKPSIATADDYPYSSRIELDHDTLGKLGLHDGDLPTTGTKLSMQLQGHVSRSEEHMVDGEKKRRLEVQITHMPHRLGTPGGSNDGDGDGAADAKPGAGLRADLEQAMKQQSKKA